VNVLLSVMDSAREPTAATLEVETLTPGRRAGRAAGRFALFTLVGAIITVLPLLHACGLVLLATSGSIAAWVTWRVSVLTVGQQSVPCPKCSVAVPVEPAKGGWPVRLHCEACGVTFGARPVP
jgi:hypothetical protein